MNPTVTLDLREYNELLSIKQGIINGKKVIVSFSTQLGATYIIHTDDELIHKLTQEIEMLRDKISEIKSHVRTLYSVTDLKEMSYWDFRKIKKQNETE